MSNKNNNQGTSNFNYKYEGYIPQKEIATNMGETLNSNAMAERLRESTDSKGMARILRKTHTH